jgi:acyl dehydratase
MTRFFEEFTPGEELATHGRTLTEADVANFAGVTGDLNPLHMDEEYARKTRYGRRVPHGQLVFALALGLAERLIAPLFHESLIAFYGVDRMRFIKPVFIGDTITLNRRVESAEPRGDAAGVITFEDRVVNQDGQLCLRYFPKYLLKRRP